MATPFARYTGQRVNPVPTGYISSFAQAGANLQKGLTSLGEDMGEAIKEYANNKDEDAALADSLEMSGQRFTDMVQKRFANEILNDEDLAPGTYLSGLANIPKGIITFNFLISSHLTELMIKGIRTC